MARAAAAAPAPPVGSGATARQAGGPRQARLTAGIATRASRSARRRRWGCTDIPRSSRPRLGQLPRAARVDQDGASLNTERRGGRAELAEVPDRSARALRLERAGE